MNEKKEFRIGPAWIATFLLLIILSVYTYTPSNKGALKPGTVFTGQTMGTTYTVKLGSMTRSPHQSNDLGTKIQKTLDKLDELMSTYIATSEISRFNSFEQTTPFPISSATLSVIEKALTVYQLSNGAFDITVAPLVNAWGFGPDKRPQKALSQTLIQELLSRIGSNHLSVDPVKGTARKAIPSLQLDLSAIAKGYALEQVSRLLMGEGHPHHMVEIGGEVWAQGKNPQGDHWRIAVEHPSLDSAQVARVVHLDGQTLATSGSARNYYQLDGRRFSHTLDPRTGAPIQHSLVSTSVLHRDCALADAWATALHVLGPEDAYRLATEQGLAVLQITLESDGSLKQTMTPKFSEHLAPISVQRRAKH